MKSTLQTLPVKQLARFVLFAIGFGSLWVSAGYLLAGPTGMAGAGTKAAKDLGTLMSDAGTIMGLLCLALGGGLAAYRASKHEDWTGPTIAACIGCAITSVCF